MHLYNVVYSQRTIKSSTELLLAMNSEFRPIRYFNSQPTIKNESTDNMETQRMNGVAFNWILCTETSTSQQSRGDSTSHLRAPAVLHRKTSLIPLRPEPNSAPKTFHCTWPLRPLDCIKTKEQDEDF